MIYDVNLDDSIKIAAQEILDGNIIIYPTDTLYGFGVDATNSKAIDQLNRIKGRKQPYSIIVNSIDMLKKYSFISCKHEKKINEFFPGPYTLILKKSKNNLSQLISLELDTIGIRIPKHNFPCNIVEKIGKPIVTTSVNIHSNKPIQKIEIMKELFPNITIFEDKNMKNMGKASTILDLTSSSIEVLRKG